MDIFRRATILPWRRKWQPTPVFFPGKSHGQRSLMGYGPWGHRELDTTEQLNSKQFCLPAGQPNLIISSHFCSLCPRHSGLSVFIGPELLVTFLVYTLLVLACNISIVLINVLCFLLLCFIFPPVTR